MKKQLLLWLCATVCLVAIAGGPSNPSAYKLDSTFNGLAAARTITQADSKLNSLSVLQDASGNVWIGGYYDDNANNFQKGFIAAFNGSNGNALTTYDGDGVYYHNQYDYVYPRNLFNVKNDQVYAGFIYGGGALLNGNSTGLGVDKVGFGITPFMGGYAQRNDSTVISFTRSSATTPFSPNQFHTYNATGGTDFASHQFANYFNSNASFATSSIIGARQTAMQPDGKMIVATNAFEVYRFKANSNQLDSTFGVNGYVYIQPTGLPNVSATPVSSDLLVEPNGSILYLIGNGGYSVLYRLNSNGTVDNTFNNNQGKYYMYLSEQNTMPITYTGYSYSKIARLSNGKILVAGQHLDDQIFQNITGDVTLTNGSWIAVLGLNTDGTDDLAFGADGSSVATFSLLSSTNFVVGRPQVNEIFVNQDDEFYLTGRYQELAGSTTPTGNDGVFVMKLTSRNQAATCAFQATVSNIVGTTNGLCNGAIDVSSPNPQAGNNVRYENIPGTPTYSVLVNTGSTTTLNGFCGGTYTLRVVVIDDNGNEVTCADTISFSIGASVAQNCTMTASYQAAPAAIGSCFDITYTVTGGTAPYTISVSYTGSQPITSNFASSSFTQLNYCSETYQVIIEDANGCKDTLDFTISSPCTTPPIPVLVYSNDTLYANSTGVTGGYDWYKDGVGLTTTIAPINYIIPAASGSYTAYAGNGACVSAESQALQVTITRIYEAQNDVAVGLYPNPAKEFVIISCNEQIETVEVYNVVGEQVKFVRDQITQINVADLSSGVYSIRLFTKNGHATKRFIKD